MASNGHVKAAADECEDRRSQWRSLVGEKLRDNIQRIHTDAINQLTLRMSEMLEEALQDDKPIKSQESVCDDKKHKNKVKSDKLPEKQFVARSSLLTQVFQSTAFQPIRNICLAVLILLLLITAADFYNAGSLKVNLDFITWCYGDMWIAVRTWAILMTSSLGVYAGFYAWASNRCILKSGLLMQTIWDSSWLSCFLLFQGCFVYFSGALVYQLRLPPPSALFILIEQVRLFMKNYAFVRSNVPRVLTLKTDTGAPANPWPAFSNFVYYHFCPTLVYRDEYPRVTTPIRWSRVAWCLVQVLAIIVTATFVFEWYIMPHFQTFGLAADVAEPPLNIAVRMLWSTLPATYIFLSGTFYGLQHAWLNAFAEMLQFADRMFYKEWWNATSYREYYRKWNVVVHDFLYTYVFKDIAALLGRSTRLRFLPSTIVILVSAVVHEYILALAFGFFYPVFLLVFGVLGVLVYFVKSSNLFIWFTSTLGYGCMTAVYCMEWYARSNCAKTLGDFDDFFTPRSWSCVPL